MERIKMWRCTQKKHLFMMTVLMRNHNHNHSKASENIELSQEKNMEEDHDSVLKEEQ
jgi:hypothetical protein